MRLNLLTALLLLTGYCAAGQSDEPLFHRISLEQGLSDARVSAIVQDKFGFMWFGTANGLNRYDGYTIRTYTEGNNGLNNAAVTSLFCSRAGVLYAGDGKNLLQYDYTKDQFAHPPGTDSSVFHRKGYSVLLMVEDAVGRIYLGCHEGLFRYDPARDSLEDMNATLGSRGAIRQVSGLTFGKDGRLWITTQKHGFFIVDARTNTYKEVPHDRQYGHDTCCYAIHRTVFLDDDHLLVGQHSYGLTVLDTRTLTFTPQQGMLGRNDSVRFNAVYRLIRDYKGRIWGGTAYFGLIQYLPQSKGVVQYKFDPFNPFSYGGYRVSALYEDREHNIWIGTGGYGVYRFHPDKGAIRYVPWNPIGQRSPPGPEVLSVDIRDSSSAWIGTDKGPALFNIRTGIFKALGYINSYSTESPGSNVNYIYSGRDGAVWFASRHLGMTRYDAKSGRSIRFYHDDRNLVHPVQRHKQWLPANLISTVAGDPDGNLLLLISGRLAMFNTKTFASRFGDSDSSEEILRLKNISEVLRDDTSLILAVQQPQSTRLLRYSFTNRSSHLLAVIDTTGKTRIHNMLLMPDGRIALATSKGVYIVSSDSRSLRQYTSSEGASHNSILGLITGLPGVIWVCTDRHIGRLDLATGEWLWLSNNEGLKPTRFFGDAFKLLPDGRIIAGSGDGLFLINQAAIVKGASQAPVLVDFKVFGKPFPLPSPLQETKIIPLTYEQNFFSFSMSTLHFGDHYNTDYSYKLEGYDKDWQPAISDRSGQYTGVPGGRYTLLIRARTGKAPWVVSPQKVQIVVGRPWWATWLFRLFVTLLTVIAVSGIYFYRVRSIRRAARLRSEYEIRLNELEMNALRTQMNPHFIFNCLNTINSYINSNQKSEANHYITRFAKLIRLILENSRQRRIALSKELEALHLYFQLESLRFESRFTYTIDVADEIDTDNVEVPPLVLQPFVENAILHGILPRPGTGSIAVRIRRKGMLVEYVVEDNGIGRAAAKKRSAEGALQKESHGMAITQKRIELFNREHNESAPVQIEDLEAGGVAAGTRVTIPLALVEGF